MIDEKNWLRHKKNAETKAKVDECKLWEKGKIVYGVLKEGTFRYYVRAFRWSTVDHAYIPEDQNYAVISLNRQEGGWSTLRLLNICTTEARAKARVRALIMDDVHTLILLRKTFR